MNKNIESLAYDIAGDMVKNEKVDNVKAFDIGTLLVIAQVIMFIINLFKKRSSLATDVKEQIRKLNLIQRIIIKMKLNRYMRNSDNNVDYDTYEEYKSKILQSTMRKITEIENTRLEAILSETPVIKSEYLI